jgi:hypothetical protein
LSGILPDRKTPIPGGVQKSHSKRLNDLEEITEELVEGQGKLAGDIGNLQRQFEEQSDKDSDRPSNAQLSLSPTGARAKLENISGKHIGTVVITVVVVIATMFVIIALIVR